MDENKNDMFKKNESSDDEFKTRVFDNDFFENLDTDKVSDDTIISQNSFIEQPFEETNENTRKPYKEKKQKRHLPTPVWILIIVVISAIIATTVILAAVDVAGITFGNDASYEVVIPSGSSTQQIAEILHDEGIVKYPFLFRIFSKFTKADGTYNCGMYVISNSSGYSSIIESLQVPGENGEEVKVTIPEGYSVNDISSLLEEKGVCTKTEFINAMKNKTYNFDFVSEIPTEKVYYTLEGYLFPDTYNFYKSKEGTNGEEFAEMAIQKMLQRTDSVLTDEVKSTAKKKGYSIHEILTMASIVELEASGYDDDMRKVAQVFYNRLKWVDEPKLLGSTPTSNYPDSRYDTNKYEGLPPGPLCSPSTTAIEAALNPDTSVTAYYFVTDKDMNFYYNNTLDAHEALIEQLKSSGKWES